MSNRLALIIANSEFDDPKLARLATPSRDAEALVQVLSDPTIGGFSVIPLINQTLREVRAQMGRLYRRRKKDDILLLYYSGHGIRDDYGDLYLAIKDTETDNASATAIDASFVRNQLDRSSSQRKIVILDCCYSGAFVRGAKAALGSSAGTLKALEGNGYGRVILTASDAVEYAWEGDKLFGQAEMSVFTHYLVEGLQTGAADLNGDGEISLDELYDYIYERVITSGFSRQTPKKWMEVEGRIIIARSHLPPAQELSLLDRVIGDLTSGDVAAQLEAVGELARLSQGQDQSLATAARAELERLSQENENPIVHDVAVGMMRITSSDETVSNKMVWVKDGKEMVRIPGGEFLYGDENKRITLPEFWIDKTPVTNAEYGRFVAATDHRPPHHWKGNTPPTYIADHPVTRISWHDAMAYTEWAGKRLPNEYEWEKAARGTDGREYPWGKWAWDRCNTQEAGIGHSTSVGQYSPHGDSTYGCIDMAGNVWEWTSTRDGPTRVVRGGSWGIDRDLARCMSRRRYFPDLSGRDFGFRCVYFASHSDA